MGCPNSKDCKVRVLDKAKVFDIDFTDLPSQSTLITNRRVTDNYIVKRVIGSGSFSDVFEAEERETKLPYAIKRIQIKSEYVRDMFVFETKALRHVQHPNIIQLKEVISTLTNAFIVMEFATGGDLFERIRESYDKRLSIAESQRVTRMITDALSYLHGIGITHRDLKAENVLYYSPGPSRVLLSDFGFASLRGPDSVLTTYCGTQEYLSPELTSKRPYTNKVDVWALGCLVFVMLSGRLPWSGVEVKEKICKVKHSYSDKIWDDIPEPAKRFIDACLEKGQDSRATSTELLRHEWIGKQHHNNKISNLKANLERMNGLSRRTSQVSSHPRSIALEQSASINNHHTIRTNTRNVNKKPFLPNISKSPSEETCMAQKRFKSGDFCSPPIVSPPCTALHHRHHRHHPQNTKRVEGAGNDNAANITIVSPPHHGQQCQHNHLQNNSLSNRLVTNETNNNKSINNFTSTTEHNVNNDSPLEEAMESEEITEQRLNCNSDSDHQATFILPKQYSSKIITKEDLIFGSSSAGSLVSRKDSILTSPELPDNSQMLQHSSIMYNDQNMTSFTDTRLQSPPQLLPGLDLFQVSSSHNNIVKRSQHSGNQALPPLTNMQRNTLFTPLKFEKLFECAVSDSTSIVTNRLDDLLTASKFRGQQGPGFLRRSRSSSPSNPCRTTALSSDRKRFTAKTDQEKVQSWLNSVSLICPKAMDADHPKLCNICVDGKSLTKSL